MRNVEKNCGFAYSKSTDESNQNFGAAKIAVVMKREGCRVGNEMVRMLMRDRG